jgi:sec-independent protein translocase protein TatC
VKEERDYLPISEHLDELRTRIVRIAVTIIIMVGINLSLAVKFITIDNITLPYLYPEPINSLSAQVINFMSKSLVPENVKLVQLAPGQAFFAQLQVAVTLAVVFSMPIIIRELALFIGPALYDNEREIIKSIALPALALFASGCVFSYFVIIPFMLDFLYRYGEVLGIQTFLSISEFINFVMQFILAFGLSFLLPIVMWFMSSSEVVDKYYWRRNIRYAIVLIALFGAIITPDGSGITMWFVSLPLIALYSIGMVIVEAKLQK